MAKKASTHYKRPDSKRSVDGRWRTLCGILVHRKQLVGLDATCATCARRDFEEFIGLPLPKQRTGFPGRRKRPSCRRGAPVGRNRLAGCKIPHVTRRSRLLGPLSAPGVVFHKSL